jgi:hypothetical protein
LDDYGADVLERPGGLLKSSKRPCSTDSSRKGSCCRRAKAKGVALTAEETKAVDDGIRAAYGPGELEKILKQKKLKPRGVAAEDRLHKRSSIN